MPDRMGSKKTSSFPHFFCPNNATSFYLPEMPLLVHGTPVAIKSCNNIPQTTIVKVAFPPF